LVFALVLAVMGCGETTGTGGSGGDGGVGGDGGTGGAGGDPVTDCRSQADGASCLLGETLGRCYADHCRVTDCTDLSTGTPCWLVSVDPRGFCEGGECKDAVSDCTGVENEELTTCTGETTSYCYVEVCYPFDCTGLENGTECVDFNPLGGTSILICQDGECR
jgi:hypothetical protein